MIILIYNYKYILLRIKSRRRCWSCRGRSSSHCSRPETPVIVWPNQTRLFASRMLRLVCFTMYIGFLLLLHVICYDLVWFFGFTHCRRTQVFTCIWATKHFSISFARVGADHEATKMSMCTYPHVEGRRLCRHHLKSDRARKQKKKALLRTQRLEAEPSQTTQWASSSHNQACSLKRLVLLDYNGFTGHVPRLLWNLARRVSGRKNREVSLRSFAALYIQNHGGKGSHMS